MRWLKRERWKAGIAIAGLLLLLVLMVWVPASAASAYEEVSRLATPGTGTVQVTPTVDATVTVLSKQQLTLQVKQVQNQLQNQNSWLANNSTALIAAITAIVVAFIGFTQWAGTTRQAKDKDLKAQAEERFKTAVTALGDEKEGTQVGGAILLRSFLKEDDKKSYEQYYIQIFDLAVAYLRLRRPSPPSEDPDGIPHSPEDPHTPRSLTTLSQALIMVFKEAFPLARSQSKGWPQSLDASSIQLDNAFLNGADLKQVWMRQASLRKAKLRWANLRGASLLETNLSGSKLRWANLSEAELIRADLSGAELLDTNLSRVKLREANLSGADLSGADIENAQSLKDTILHRVTGLTKEQLEACKAKGAIIDEDTTTSPPQSPISPPAPLQSNDVQAPSAPSAQVKTPSPDTGGNGAASSQHGVITFCRTLFPAKVPVRSGRGLKKADTPDV